MGDTAKTTKPRAYTSDPLLKERVTRAIDETPGVPEKVHGRLTWLSRLMAQRGQPVSTETVRKWANGEAVPRGKNLEVLSDILGVDPGWLTLGTTPVASKREMRDFAVRASGAVHYVIGRMLLDRVTAALPDPDDEISRSAAVDIHAIIDGRAIRFSVAAARADGNDMVVSFPSGASKNELLAVIPGGPAPDVLHIPRGSEPDRTLSDRLEYFVRPAGGSGRAKISGNSVLPIDDMKGIQV